MICRRCDRNIPDGSEICPLCGVAQGRLMSRDPSYGRALTRRKPSSNRVSLVTLLIVIVAAVVLILLVRAADQNKKYDAVVAAFESGDTERLEILGTQFMSRFPGTDQAAEVEAMIKDAMDLVSPEEYSRLEEEYAQKGEQEREEQVAALIASARDEILGIASAVVLGPAFNEQYGFQIRWTNRSTKAITEITFYVAGYDGEEAVPTMSGETSVAGRETSLGESEWIDSSWLYVWDQPVTRLSLLGVFIRYADGSALTLPPEVLETVWEP